jgi:hypothetical protein
MVIGRASAALAIVGADWSNALAVLLYFAVSVAYGMAFEWYWRGQTHLLQCLAGSSCKSLITNERSVANRQT